ncbi:MAG: fasciclin domain-containing protein [Streptosporangiaceae bacterium]
MRSKLAGVAAMAIGAGLAAAACGSGGTSAAATAQHSVAAEHSPAMQHSPAAQHSPAMQHSPAAAPPAPAARGTFGPACGQLPGTGPGSLSGMAAAPVVTAASHNPMLTFLAHAVTAAGLAHRLNSARAITVFAPDNSAFAGLGSGNVRTLLASRADLIRVLKDHVVDGRVTPAELAAGRPLTSLAGLPVRPAVTGADYKIDNADVICGNVQTANATVYILNKVLIPGTG